MIKLWGVTFVQVNNENTELQGRVTQMEEKLSLAEQEKQRIEKVSCYLITHVKMLHCGTIEMKPRMSS